MKVVREQREMYEDAPGHNQAVEAVGVAGGAANLLLPATRSGARVPRVCARTCTLRIHF